MIAVYRWILGLRKKEHFLRTNYHASHRHFLLYMSLDAVLSFALVFAGFQILGPHASVAKELVQVGAVPITGDELINHVREEKLDAYWLGSILGFKFFINHQLKGITDISYLPATPDSSGKNLVAYEVTTYRSRKDWDGRPHSLLAVSNTRIIKVNGDLTIKINTDSMTIAIATLRGHSEIIEMNYSASQTVKTLEANAISLRQVQ
jgi:hypothetical protein